MKSTMIKNNADTLMQKQKNDSSIIEQKLNDSLYHSRSGFPKSYNGKANHYVKKNQKRKDKQISKERDFKSKIVPQMGWLVDQDVEESFIELARKLPDRNFYDKFNENFSKTNTNVDKLEPIFKDIASKLPNVSDPESIGKIVTSFMSSSGLSEVKSDILSTVKNFMLIGLFSTAFIRVMTVKEATTTDYVLLGASGFGLVFFGDICSNKSLYSKLSEMLRKVDFSKCYMGESESTSDDILVEPQMEFESFQSIIDTVGTFFTGYVSVTAGRDVPGEIFKNASTFSRTRNSFSDILSSIISGIEKVINWIRVDMLKLTPYRFFSTGNHDVENWIKEVDKLHVTARDGDLYKTRETLLSIDNAIKTGEKYYKDMPTHKSVNNLSRLLLNEIQSLKKLKSEYEIMRVNVRGTRQEPVGVLFRGGPSTTKSIVLEYLAHAVMSATLDDNSYETFKTNPEIFIYNRNFNSLHFDGLTHKHQVVYFDEFGQKKDTAGIASGFDEVISIGNSFEFLTTQAELMNKGNITAQFKFMFATTNLIEVKPESIVSAEALMRRFNLQFVVVPRPQYCTEETKDLDVYHQKFDYSKIPVDPETGISVITPEVQHFILTDSKGVPISDERYDFDHVVKMTLQWFKKKKVWFEGNRMHFNKISKDFRTKFSSLDVQGTNNNNSNVEPQGYFDHFDFSQDVYKDPEQDNTVNVKNCTISKLISLHYGNKTLEEYLYFRESSVGFYFNTISEFKVFLNQFKYYLTINSRAVVSPKLVVCDDELIFFLLWEKEPKLIEAYLESNFNKKIMHYLDYMQIPLDLPRVQVKNRVKSLLDVYRKTIDDILQIEDSSPWKHVSNIIAISLPIVATLGTTYIAYKLYDLFISFWNPNIPQSYNEGDKQKTKNKSSLTKMTTSQLQSLVDSSVIATPQASVHDSSGEELAKSIFSSNCFEFAVEVGTELMQKAGYVFFVKGTYGIVPKHFILALIEKCCDSPGYSDNIIALSRKGIVKYRVPIKHVITHFSCEYLSSVDAAIVEFPAFVQPARDRIENFLQDSDVISAYSNLLYILPTVSGNDTMYNTGTCNIEYTKPLQISEQSYGSYSIARYVSYTLATKKGDCGAPLCVLNTKLGKKKIIGIHVAGESRLGLAFANIITQESLLKELSNFPEFEYTLSDELDLPEPQTQFPELSRFDIIGETPKYHRMPVETEIVKSPMYDALDPALSKPANLCTFMHNSSIINPIHLSLNKFCISPPYVDENKLCDAISNICEMFNVKTYFNVEKRIFTTFEALYGLEEDVDFKAMASASSSGFECNSFKKDEWKRKLFRTRNNVRTVNTPNHPKLIAYDKELKLIEDMYLVQKKRPLWIVTDNPKDERKPIDKVNRGKLRLFFGCSFKYFTLVRKYFGAFMLYIKKNFLRFGVGIGLNNYSTDWDFLAKDLGRFSKPGTIPMVGAGDYSGFDGSEIPQIHLAILQMINDWYDDEHMLIRKYLFIELVNSRHMYKNCLYEWWGSLPSGHPLTPIINCLYNMIAMRLCFNHMYPNLNFNDNVVLIVMGDDHVFAVSEECLDFNETTLPDLMKMFGLTYTTELKGKAVIPLRPLTEVEFLKRKFYYDEVVGRWIAPLRLDVAKEICYWTKNNQMYFDISATNLIETCRELSLHPKEVYESNIKKLIKYFEKNNLSTRFKLIAPINRKYRDVQRETLNLDFIY